MNPLKNIGGCSRIPGFYTSAFKPFEQQFGSACRGKISKPRPNLQKKIVPHASKPSKWPPCRRQPRKFTDHNYPYTPTRATGAGGGSGHAFTRDQSNMASLLY